MKKLVVLALLVVTLGVAWAVHAQTAVTPERAACRHVVTLCNEHVDEHEVDACVDQVHEVRRVAGPQAVDQTIACIDGMNTCGGAMGCMAGGAVRSAGAFLRDFGAGLAH